MKLLSPKKDEIIFEFILKDHVPTAGLWWFGWGLARHFVVALNIGTMGFFWWRLPEQISRYYESIQDLDNKGLGIAVERTPALKVDWGENRVLTEQDLQRVLMCMATLPGPHQRDRHTAYNYYIAGLTFLSLNDIHWQCETYVFGNFFHCLKAMMEEAGDWKPGSVFHESLLDFVQNMFPNFDEREHVAELCKRFETNSVEGLNITLKDATFMKIVCDAYFLRAAKEKLERRQNDRSDDPSEHNARENRDGAVS